MHNIGTLAVVRKRVLQRVSVDECTNLMHSDLGLIKSWRRWVVRLAEEHRSWGYDRIVGALANLGYTLSDQTVGNITREAA